MSSVRLSPGTLGSGEEGEQAGRDDAVFQPPGGLRSPANAHMSLFALCIACDCASGAVGKKKVEPEMYKD